MAIEVRLCEPADLPQLAVLGTKYHKEADAAALSLNIHGAYHTEAGAGDLIEHIASIVLSWPHVRQAEGL